MIINFMRSQVVQILSNSDNKDYMVDIAKEKVYINQDEEYYEEYTKWRNDPENRFAYSFQHDSREHTYVDGEGFADRLAQTEEKSALTSCFSYLGGLLLLILLFQIIQYFLMHHVFDSDFIGWIYFSQRSSFSPISADQEIVYCAVRLTAYVTAALVSASVLKMPRKVVLPNEKVSLSLMGFGISLSLIFLILARVFDMSIAKVFGMAGIDMCSYSYAYSENIAAQCFYLSMEIFFVPLLAEIIFRGFVLQLFRQFGDYFAVLISSFACAVIYHDVSEMLFMFSFGMIFGSLVLRSGSLKLSIVVRITVMAVYCLLNHMSVVWDSSYRYFWECAVSIAIVVAAAVAMPYFRSYIRPSEKPADDTTELTAVQKLKLTLNSGIFIVWLLLAMLVVILNIRIV